MRIANILAQTQARNTENSNIKTETEENLAKNLKKIEFCTTRQRDADEGR